MAAIDLIVLGMIKKKPQSAYELQKNVEYRNLSRWVRISTPSIYKKVIQLEAKGYLQSEIQKNGRMPEKVIYHITESGDKYFYSLMEQNAGNTVSVFLDFNAVIMNLNLVSDGYQALLLDQIEANLNEFADVLEKNRRQKEQIPVIGKSILAQQSAVAAALRDWIRNFRKEFLEKNHG